MTARRRSARHWLLRPLDGGREAIPGLRASTVLDDIGLGAHMAEAGLGLALLPVAQIDDAVRSGRLVHVLQDWRGPEREIFAVWPSGRLLSERARVLCDYMEAHIRAEPALQGMVPVPETGGQAAALDP
ncbi:LysR substrate-binding domain-containing protein [Mangrovicoccus ximenensis]|uniref:LysR substrate-binding domain-containing protein n=1 Tax=Mangrovicoccus ximenensis TaxID=1911570 RepID=UPI00137511C8|nr:LysR substrate-binding domain-containing protein [Mangrovicoccus ximenensis]